MQKLKVSICVYAWILILSFSCCPGGLYAQENIRFYNNSLIIKPTASQIKINDQLQFSKITVLKSLNPRIFKLRINKGMVERCVLNLKAETLGLSESDGAETLSSAFFQQYQDFFRISNPSASLLMMKRSGIVDETQIFRQYSKGIPVYGGWVETVINKPSSGQSLSLTHAYGNYIPDLDIVFHEPGISYAKAKSIVAEEFGVDNSSFKILVPTKLWVFDQALLAPRCSDCPVVPYDPHLAWRVIFSSPRDHGTWTDAFVDTATGELLYSRPRSWNIDIDIENANHDNSSSCWYTSTSDDAWFDEDGVCKYEWYCPFSSCCSNACADGWNCASPDQEGYDCYHYTWENYHFYQDVFGRNSYDGGGEEFEMYVHLGKEGQTCSSDCGLFSIHQFVDGTVTLDIVSHEVGHSFHRSEVDFTYQNESGAIAEHIADSLGMFVSHWSTTYTDADWLEGEDITPAQRCGAVRNLEDPTKCGAPDHYTGYLNGTGDYGQVHDNSNILSKALYLMTVGGTHSQVPGLVISGISERKSRAIYHRVVTEKLPSNPHFADFRNFAVDACKEMTISPEIGVMTTSNDCCQVKNAFYACGIGIGDNDCDGIGNPWDSDRDNDGIVNSSDNCPGLPNSSQVDTDGDGQGDRCDPDDDNDNFVDSSDNCPTHYNPSQSDIDNDGIGDLCDDEDTDGVIDIRDNCPGLSNPAQSDIDRDGKGDVCDEDMDGDGINNSADNCPKYYNNFQEDGDHDGAGDVCDNCPNIFNNQSDDLDHDGIGDACDSNIDGDSLDNEHDECPEEAGMLPLGCPPSEELWNKLHGRLQKDPLRIPLPFGAQYGGDFIPTIGDYVKMNFDVNLGFPAGFETEQPLNLRLSIVDETGRILASKEQEFFCLQDNTGITSRAFPLSFSPVPSYFSVRSLADNNHHSTIVNQYALLSDHVFDFSNYGALPVYYLLIGADPGNEKNAKILSSISFSITKTDEMAGCAPGHPEDCMDSRACNKIGAAWCEGACTSWEKCVGQQNSLPVPDSGHIFRYDPVAYPVLDSNASKCSPFAVGNLEAGTLTLRTGLPSFNGPVDIYFAIQATQVNPYDIYFLVPEPRYGYTLVPFSTHGLQPWKTSIVVPVYQDFFGEIPLDALPSGPYTLYTLVTPAGSLNSYYLWINIFNAP